MCVAVTLAPGSTLTRDEVERMNRSNSDGVGVAWAHNGAVHWFKTTKVEPEHIERLIYYWSNFPRLVHFRLATAGGTRSDLCHPFEVGPLASCRTQGSSGKVMIHNGHWGRWSEVHALLEAEDLLPDKGPWSDSRLAAYLAHADPDWLQALGGRVAMMDGEGKVDRMGDWQQLRQGIYVSNKIWDYNNYRRGGYTGYGEWKGWEWDEHDWAEYMAASEEREKKDAEEQKKLAEAEKAEAAVKQGKTGKAHKGTSTAGAHLVGGPHGSSGGSSGASIGPDTGGGSTVSSGAGSTLNAGGSFGAGNARRTGFQVGRGSAISEEPFYNATTGKWHRYDNASKSVVEAPSPGSSSRNV
jgi:hypothetical protein